MMYVAFKLLRMEFNCRKKKRVKVNYTRICFLINNHKVMNNKYYYFVHQVVD